MPRSVPPFAAVFVRQQLANADGDWPIRPRHDDAGGAIVVPDQLAAGAAWRDNPDRPVLLLWRRMPDRDDGVDVELAGDRDRLAERNRFGADRHAAKIGVEAHAGEDFPRAQPDRRSNLLPVETVALADRVGRGFDQFGVGLAERHFDNSFNPSRINCAVSAP